MVLTLHFCIEAMVIVLRVTLSHQHNGVITCCFSSCRPRARALHADAQGLGRTRVTGFKILKGVYGYN